MRTCRAMSGAEAGRSYGAPIPAGWGGLLGRNAIRLILLVIRRGVSRRREVAAAAAAARAVAVSAACTTPATLPGAPTAATVRGSMPCAIRCCPIRILPILVGVLPSLILPSKSLLSQNILASPDMQLQHLRICRFLRPSSSCKKISLQRCK